MDRILVGDVVNVALDMEENCYLDSVTVLYVPESTGEAWEFEDSRGYVYIVQNYGHITKKNIEEA